MTLEEKIKKISRVPDTSKLISLDSDSAIDIETFWKKVVEPLLPDYNTMKKWHELLIEYISLPDAVFMIRKGNEESQKYVEEDKADALRRGFLTKTDAGYWFFYNDNDFATYMLAMVLDCDIIDTLTSRELLTYFQTPNSMVRFNKSGSGGVEKERAFYKIDGTQPRISKNGYTVAHIFDVNSHYYDTSLGFNNTGGEEALKSANVKIDKGMYSDYTLQGTISGKNIYYRHNYHPGTDARKFLEAHMLRFLHPLNYFCAPKDNRNGYVYCEFTDHIKNRRFKRISGYEHLLYYAHQKFKEKYGDIYDDFLKRIMLPENTFDFFEKCSATPDFYASEIINIQYANPLASSSSKTLSPKIKVTKPTVDLTNITEAYLKTFKVGEIANQVLRAIIESGVNSGRITKSEIDKWKTEKGKRLSTFKLSQPLLSLSRKDSKGVDRCYEEPIVCYGESLYLNSQWPKRDIEMKMNLIQWIVNWVTANGGKI